jgi:hypothetical protein
VAQTTPRASGSIRYPAYHLVVTLDCCGALALREPWSRTLPAFLPWNFLIDRLAAQDRESDPRHLVGERHGPNINYRHQPLAVVRRNRFKVAYRRKAVIRPRVHETSGRSRVSPPAALPRPFPDLLRRHCSHDCHLGIHWGLCYFWRGNFAVIAGATREENKRRCSRSRSSLP